MNTPFLILVAPCDPGSFSSNGIAPCSLCPLNSYSDNYGVSACTQCGPSQITGSTGASSATSCIGLSLFLGCWFNTSDVCGLGEFSSTGRAPCSPCAAGSYANATQMTVCISCPDGATTVSTGATNDSFCGGSRESLFYFFMLQYRAFPVLFRARECNLVCSVRLELINRPPCKPHASNAVAV